MENFRSFNFVILMTFATFVFAAEKTFALTSLEQIEIKKLIYWMPGFACQDHKALKNCLLWTTPLCEAQVEKSLSSCLNLHAKEIKLPGPSLESWKDKVIGCATKDVVLQQQSLIIKSKHCENVGVR